MTIRELENFLKTIKDKDMEIKICITDEENNVSFARLEDAEEDYIEDKDCFDEDDERDQKVIILSGYCENYQSGF